MCRFCGKDLDLKDIEELLIDSEKELTPEFEKLLEVIFNRFAKSAPKDGMTREEFGTFAQAINGTPLESEEIEEIWDFFLISDQDRLTKIGFLDFYQTQTSSDAWESWRDIHKLGYTLMPNHEE